MTRFQQLPEIIAIFRTPENREPFLQVLRTTYIRRSNDYDDERSYGNYHVVQDIRSPNANSTYILEEVQTNSRTHGVHKIQCKNSENDNILDVYYWYVPFCISSRGSRIPIVDFQHRSWVPSARYCLPLGRNYDIPTVISIVDHIKRERLVMIRNEEDHTSSILSESRQHRNNPFNHRSRELESQQRENDIEELRTLLRRNIESARNPPPPPPPEIRIVEVTVPVERIVIQTVSMPLPKPIGELILSNARNGTESCPITQTPYKQCSKICVSSCFHIFDTESLTRWRTDHTSCPVCRAEIQNVVSE